MEEWKEVYGNNYFISNYGNIKNRFKLLKQFKNADGYLCVVLTIDGKRKHFRTHKLLYEIFNNTQVIWPMTINHKNKIRDDNRLDNLESISVSDNVKGKNNIFTDEHKNKISNSLKGLIRGPMSDEHRNNLSSSLKGKVPWNKGKKIKK